MHQDLLEYFQKHQRHLEHFLALCIEKTEPELVHQLRVSIKRMRAVLHFAGHVIGTEEIDAKKQLKSLRKLFKITGSIRDVQVQQKQIPEYESELNTHFEAYKTYLLNLEKQSIKDFYSFIEDSKPIHKLDAGRDFIEKSLAALTPEEIRLRAGQLLAGRCDTLRLMLHARPDDKKLHEMRTIIKQMRYIMSVMRKNEKQAAETIVSQESLAETEELLGKWHDVVVGIGFLGNFRDTNDFKHASEAKDYKILAETLEAERIKLRKQIIKCLGKSFCN
jgi:CHAD domain-containing protein